MPFDSPEFCSFCELGLTVRSIAQVQKGSGVPLPRQMRLVLSPSVTTILEVAMDTVGMAVVGGVMTSSPLLDMLLTLLSKAVHIGGIQLGCAAVITCKGVHYLE